MTHSFPTRRSSDLSDGESRCRFEPAAIGNFLDCRPPFRRASFCKQCLGARDTAFSGKLGQCVPGGRAEHRSEEHTSELQSLMRISYAVFCLKKKTKQKRQHT